MCGVSIEQVCVWVTLLGYRGGGGGCDQRAVDQQVFTPYLVVLEKAGTVPSTAVLRLIGTLEGTTALESGRSTHQVAWKSAGRLFCSKT